MEFKKQRSGQEKIDYENQYSKNIKNKTFGPSNKKDQQKGGIKNQILKYE
jgi:hypothetical protein